MAPVKEHPAGGDPWRWWLSTAETKELPLWLGEFLGTMNRNTKRSKFPAELRCHEHQMAGRAEETSGARN